MLEFWVVATFTVYNLWDCSSSTQTPLHCQAYVLPNMEWFTRFELVSEMHGTVKHMMTKYGMIYETQVNFQNPETHVQQNLRDSSLFPKSITLTLTSVRLTQTRPN